MRPQAVALLQEAAKLSADQSGDDRIGGGLYSWSPEGCPFEVATGPIEVQPPDVHLLPPGFGKTLAKRMTAEMARVEFANTPLSDAVQWPC